jgi:hypothetical protein
MTDTAKLAALLHEAALKYPVVCRIVDGDEADWPHWYAKWLLELADFPSLLPARPERHQVAEALVEADRYYAHAAPAERWEDVYARQLSERFGV